MLDLSGSIGFALRSMRLWSEFETTANIMGKEWQRVNPRRGFLGAKHAIGVHPGRMHLLALLPAESAPADDVLLRF